MSRVQDSWPLYTVYKYCNNEQKNEFSAHGNNLQFINRSIKMGYVGVIAADK